MGVGEEKHGYRLGEVLGRNVSGGRLTYAATRLTDGREVIIKQFSFAREDADWAGFKAHQRELETLQSLDHPSIPAFLDAFQVEDGFWLVQERVQAPPLSHRRRWEFAEVEQIARDLLDILVDLQNRNPPIIHRDLKPENILRHEHGEVHLIDFGLARDAQREGSSSTVAAGTPGFMAPEQFFNTGVDERTDLYGLGATLYALLAGIGTEDMRLHVSTSFVLNFDKLPEDTPEVFRDWLEVLTRPEKDERFDDAHTARSALEEALAVTAKESKPAASTAMVKRPSPQKSSAVAVAKSAENPMLAQWTGEQSKPSSWKSRIILGAIATVILSAISIPIMWRTPTDMAPSFMRPLLLATKAIRMPGENGRYTCSGWLSLDLKAGEYGVPERYNTIHVRHGCHIRFEGVQIEQVTANHDSHIEFVDSTVKSIHVDESKAEFRGGNFESINAAKTSAITLSNAKGKNIYLSRDAKLEGNDFEVRRMYLNNASFARVARVRVLESLNISDQSRLVADKITASRTLSVDEESILLLKEPLLARPLPEDRNILVLKPDEDIDKRYEAFLKEANVATQERRARKALEQALRDSERDLRLGGCNKIGTCVQEQPGKQEARIQVEAGKATLLEGPPCIEEALPKLAPHRKLEGTLTCKYNVYDKNGAKVFNVTGGFREKK